MKRSAAPKRVIKGDVFAIPIPGVGFAYARECFAACVCIYDVLTKEAVSPVDLAKFRVVFWTGFFWHGGIKNGDWQIVLRQKLTEEDGWGPPTKELAIYKGGMRRVWHQGKCQLVPDAQTNNMEITGSMSPQGLIEEILARKKEFRKVARKVVLLKES